MSPHRSEHGEERRRVLLVINSLVRGGAETQLLGVARALRQAGDEVVVATLRGGNDFAEQIEGDGLQTWLPASPDAGWDVRHAGRIVWRAWRWRPEVTVSFLLQATLLTRLLNVLVRPRRSIASMRNEKLETRLRTWLYRVTCGLDDVVVTNSRSAARTLRHNGTVPDDPRRIVVIPNGIDADAVRARATADPARTRAALGVAAESVLLLGIGRLSDQKDWPTLLDALARTDDSVSCVIAGEGPQREALEALAARLGVSERLTFLGLRHDVPDLMAAADALVLSSRYEGTPNVVLEALAMGLPVIASDVGACRELLEGTEGEVVPPGDAAALAAAIGRRPRRAGDSSAPASTERFAWGAVQRQWVALVHDRRAG
ncbi:hypothetical protein GCM10011519_16880 [Marmoricola endophyticus]|uniref:Glycosyltransferase subfamily 4-like N-terminal domain-containing protein n=1 Tax=Marmoricola endophyticus TaxID=2040280 RepID=A0A917F4Y5_9ACTN|nr:glycosyltransferase [Marmoricola endophyticus]GGF43646.1 hypothetical protein GCM10011519_16880 [Marmoricola endophyticus]